MSDSTSPVDPDVAERRFAQMLDDAGLPRFDSATHRAVSQVLELSWDHGFTLHVDLTRDDFEPFDGVERAAILGEPVGIAADDLVSVYVAGSAADPRTVTPMPGVVVHRGPPLHPDDVTVHNGIPITSPSRTLIDLAELVTPDELRRAFASAEALGLLDIEGLRQARARVEWRASLPVLDEVIAEFSE